MSNELRFSRRVPEDGVNLAWIELPELSPEENVSLIETSRFVAENTNRYWERALSQSVTGSYVLTEGVTGNLYYTEYNPTTAATGQVTSGVAYSRLYRTATDRVAPSGFVVHNFTSEIQVEPPEPSETGTWRLRLRDGLVQRQLVLSRRDHSWLSRVFDPGDTLYVYYTLPEFCRIPTTVEHASGNSFRDHRVVTVSGAVLEALDEKLLQCPDGDLYELLSLTINGEEQLAAASGSVVEATTFPHSVLSHWDPWAGQLTLRRGIGETDEVRATYRYREHLLVYEGYRDRTGVFHDLDLNPGPGHTYDGGRSSRELLEKSLYLYLLPTAAYRTQRADGTVEQDRKLHSGLRWVQDFLRWEAVDHLPDGVGVDGDGYAPAKRRSTFGHTYFGSATFMSVLPGEQLATPSASGVVGASGLTNWPSALVLAKVYVTPNSQIENVQVLDTRVRGGGVYAQISPEDTRVPGDFRQQLETFWDVGGWDGQAVPLGGAFILEVPRAVLTGENGYPQFSHAELEQIVQLHQAAGTKVIIEYV